MAHAPSIGAVHPTSPSGLHGLLAELLVDKGSEIESRRRNTDLLAWPASDGAFQPQEGTADLIPHGGVALLVRDGYRGGRGVVVTGATAAVKETAMTAGSGRRCCEGRTTAAGAKETSSRGGGGRCCEGSGIATAGAEEAVSSSGGGGGVSARKHLDGCVKCVKLLFCSMT